MSDPPSGEQMASAARPRSAAHLRWATMPRPELPRVPAPRRPDLPDARPRRPARGARAARPSRGGDPMTLVDRRAGAGVLSCPTPTDAAGRPTARRRDRGGVHVQPLPVRARLAATGSPTRRATTPIAACGFLAINSNDADRYPRDSYEAMQQRVAAEDWPMPYLHDASQEVARSYGAKTTPDVFVLDAERPASLPRRARRRLRRPRPAGVVAARRARRGAGRREPARAETKPVGCSIKWKLIRIAASSRTSRQGSAT